jgi:hypothetical protein
MSLLEQMKAEHPRALAQRNAEIRKQGGGEPRGLTTDSYQTEPTPRPRQRFPGDERTDGNMERFIGDFDEDEEDDTRSEHRRPHDAESSVGESEGGGVMKVQKAQETGLVGSDPECQKIEKRVAEIDERMAKVSRYETGSPSPSPPWPGRRQRWVRSAANSLTGTRSASRSVFSARSPTTVRATASSSRVRCQRRVRSGCTADSKNRRASRAHLAAARAATLVVQTWHTVGVSALAVLPRFRPTDGWTTARRPACDLFSAGSLSGALFH